VRGGVNGGDGGLVEVSSKGDLFFGGDANAGAPVGSPGQVLLDPQFIIISASGSPPFFSFIDPNPSAGDGFGNTLVVPLDTGTVVVTAPLADFGLGAVDAGAV